VTHFVSSNGTFGTITGVSRYFRSQGADVKCIGVQPAPGSIIPGTRKWPEGYVPAIYDETVIDCIEFVAQQDAEEMARRLAAEEGIFVGPSSGAALFAALKLAETVSNATIVFVVCDRGDRYLSLGFFPA
jgi:cysteine synthase B